MNNLPIELLEDIFLKLNNATILNCRLVCQEWKTIIDSNDFLWKEMCRREFIHSSKVARSKSKNISWLHIYMNLKCWPKIMETEKKLTTLLTFEKQYSKHLLNLGNDLLTLQDDEGLISYNMTSKEFSRIYIPGLELKECINVVNSDYVTVYHFKDSLYIQKETIYQVLIQAEKIILSDFNLYFSHKGFVFKCNLNKEPIAYETVFESAKDILAIHFNNGCLYIFTSVGEIYTIKNKHEVGNQKIKCPDPWILTMKQISVLDGDNFICYSRDFFYVKTDLYNYFSVSLYLDSPTITSLFLYEDIVLIGTIACQIVLYRLSKQKAAQRPVFDMIMQLPLNKYAVSLDVYETETGPSIIAGTLNDVFIINVNFR